MSIALLVVFALACLATTVAIAYDRSQISHELTKANRAAERNRQYFNDIRLLLAYGWTLVEFNGYWSGDITDTSWRARDETRLRIFETALERQKELNLRVRLNIPLLPEEQEL